MVRISIFSKWTRCITKKYNIFILYFQNIYIWKFFYQGVSSHGKPGKVMEFPFFSPGLEVMEIDCRFWKIHKKS